MHICRATAASAILFCATSPTLAAKPYESEACLDCHSDESLTLTLQGGTEHSVFVDADKFAQSAHGGKLKCSSCHPDEVADPHPPKNFKDEREIALLYSDRCKSCHVENYTKTLSGVHHAQITKGNPKAPSCVDCHGAHSIVRPSEPRSRISQTCAKCHQRVYQAYARSVHGQALVEAENRDVPACTDCHQAHDIKDPRGRDWRLGTPQLCGKCHTNRRLMSKYGISPNVVSTYLADFHGVASTLQRGHDDDHQLAAVCTDCHGVHDIKTTHGEAAAVMKANLVNVCRRCHADADASFPAAWLSHYQPSWSKAPLVYAVRVFYMIMIPFTIGGLILQIVLHLWRVVVKR